MVYKKKGTHTYKCRVTAPDGGVAELSTGCRAEEDATEVEAAVRRWEGKKGKKYGRPELLAALVDGRLTLSAAFEASLDGSLERLLAGVLDAPAPRRARNLADLVQEWHDWKAKQKKGAKSADDYLRQLATLFPDVTVERDETGAVTVGGTLPLTLFTRVEVAARLDALTVQGPTKNRYKLAVSGLAKFLVRRGVLETNVVRDIEGFGENPARMVYYERPEAQRLVFGLPQPYAGVAAFAGGFCMEWGGLAALLARDVSLTAGDERVYVRGTKTTNRLRSVPLVAESRWLLPVLAAAVKGKAPNALVFAGLNKSKALREQRAVATALKIRAVGEETFGQHSLHDWRHTHTVQLLRDGYDEAIAAAHLGHGDTNLVRTRYGVFLITAADYQRKRVTITTATAPATTISTTTLDRVERGGRK